jgi:DNA repair protein RadA/Sms
MVFFGEVGLSGAVRPVPHANLRLKEAAKLGFARAVAPQNAHDQEPPKLSGMATRPIRHIGEAIADIAALGRNEPPKTARPGSGLNRREDESTRGNAFAISGLG